MSFLVDYEGDEGYCNSVGGYCFRRKGEGRNGECGFTRFYKKFACIVWCVALIGNNLQKLL